jgi:hypothetical protein
VQKLALAAQISFAERALLHDQYQMLTRMNNEAKVRQSTRSVVLGKAKVMSFEASRWYEQRVLRRRPSRARGNVFRSESVLR